MTALPAPRPNPAAHVSQDGPELRNDLSPGKRRSEKRQRTRLVAVRMTPDEKRAIAAAAIAGDVSVGRFIRAAALMRTKSPVVHPNPRVSLDKDGTLDDFCATDVKLVHFEALDEASWYATIELADGEVWQLNFGARSPVARGYGRAERVQ